MSSYATSADLYLWGAPQAAFSIFTPTQQQSALDGAADVIDGYLRDHYTLPLQPVAGAYPPAIRRACAIIASFDMLTSRGYDPATGPSEQLAERYVSTVRWLEKIAKGEISPPLLDSSPGGVVGGYPVNQASTLENGGLIPTTGGASFVNSSGVTIGPPALRGWK